MKILKGKKMKRNPNFTTSIEKLKNFINKKYWSFLIIFIIMSFFTHNCSDNNITGNKNSDEIAKLNISKEIETKDLNPFNTEISIIQPNNNTDLIDLNNLDACSIIDQNVVYEHNGQIYEGDFLNVTWKFTETSPTDPYYALTYKLYVNGTHIGTNQTYNSMEYTDPIELSHFDLGSNTIKIKVLTPHILSPSDAIATETITIYKSIQGMHIDGPTTVVSGTTCNFTAVLEGGNGLMSPTIYEWWVKRVSDEPLIREGISTRALPSDGQWHKLDDTDNQISIGLDLYEHYIKCVVNYGEASDIKFVHTINQ